MDDKDEKAGKYDEIANKKFRIIGQPYPIYRVYACESSCVFVNGNGAPLGRTMYIALCEWKSGCLTGFANVDDILQDYKDGKLVEVID